MQSLLLEGGPRLAASFLDSDLVDKLLLFVAPTIAGEGPFLLGKLARQVRLTRLETQDRRRGRAPDRLRPRALIHQSISLCLPASTAKAR